MMSPPLPGRVLDHHQFEPHINGIRLTPIDFVKYLGMFIDKFLNWNQHIHELRKKLSQANGILSKLRYSAPIDVCLQVYLYIITRVPSAYGLYSRVKNIQRTRERQRASELNIFDE